MADCQNCDSKFRSVGPTKTSTKIRDLLQEQVPFVENDLFKTKEPVSLLRATEGGEVLPKLTLSTDSLNAFYNSKTDNITMNIPGPNGENLKLVLTKVKVYPEDFQVTNGTNVIDIPLGVHYFGLVEGYEDSRVIMNIFKDEVTGIITIDNDPIELTRDKSVRDLEEYSLHRTRYAKGRFSCNTETTVKKMSKIDSQISSRAPLDKYIRFQLETVDNNYTDIMTLFMVVQDIYLNDPDVEVNLVPSGITLWTTAPGPSQIPFAYVPSNGANVSNLILYSNYRTTNPLPNVDAYQMVPVGSEQQLGGIAWIDTLCYIGGGVGPFGISVIEPGPTPAYTVFSWNAKVLAHELAHNIGSVHTFDCEWSVPGPSGPTGSLGGCGITGNEGICVPCSNSAPVGTCYQPGPNGYVYTSVNGATGYSGQTIMSYCENFTPMVFGAQPGALIRNNVLNSSCLLCLDKNTSILMGDGSYKLIKYIVRGDCVMGDNSGLVKYKVCKVSIGRYSPNKNLEMVVFEKGCLGADMPSKKLIVTGAHAFFYQGARRSARCFKNLPGVKYYESIKASELLEVNEKGSVELYDLQFDDEGSYVAEGVQVESRSPWSAFTPLEKDLYFDLNMYKEERTTDSLTHTTPRSCDILSCP